MTAKKVLFVSAAFALLADVGVAVAQQTVASGAEQESYSNFARDRNVSVRERPHPGYEAVGVRAGAFMVWPKLNTTAEYDDNIFATSVDQKSDTIWHVAPEVDVTSNWSRHELDLYAKSILNRYSSYSSQDTTDYSVGATGRLDVLRTEQITGGLNWNRLTEPRTSAPAQGLQYPIQYEMSDGYLTGAKEFNRLRISGRFDVQNFLYLNRSGNPQQHDRDRTMYVETGRADYALSPDTALFVEVAGNQRDYRLSATPNVLATYPGFEDRTSKGVEALVGANFDITALMRGEIGVGYMRQKYDNPAFQNISGLGARAKVEWFPTPLTTLTFTGSRTVEDAGIVGASGYLSTNLAAQVDHELLRNVILTAQAGYGNDAYRGIDRHDKRYTAGLSASYLLNRSVGLTLGYTYFKQNSRGAAGSGDFTVNKVGATLTLQY